ncbi:hypothetical protein DSL72_002442 [Monilinia vaccinii-corymbosi]|uniref:Uncharacterized protein n=1 Tax=Monilinia vaccinii-corymbosi TaxID=61207 RepID=A0A8A3PCJ1_9HELO|nr:hypothetical protein DSL72_002442 [Monilinia vaccinii-corymbosi]
MNWTGGRLRRHSGKSFRGGGALSNRQKEHFARVKANLRSGGQGNSSEKWTIFDKSSVAQPQRQALETHASSGRNYEPTSRGQRERVGVEPELWDQRKELDQYPAIDSFRRDSKTRYENTRSPSVEIVQKTFMPDDDLYSATPPPLRIKRERAGSPKLRYVPRGCELRESKEEPMEEKIRKLLSKGDWVGLSIRRLPQMRFNPQRRDEDIGRRRKVDDGHRARYSKLQTRISSPFASRKFQMHEREEDHVRERAESDVKIWIGGRVVPPGISSSSRQSRIVRQSTTRMMHRIPLSDEMLLDDEYVTEDRDNLISDKFLSASKARTHGSGGHQDSAMSSPSSGEKKAPRTYKHRQRPKVLEYQPLRITNMEGAPHALGGKYSPFSRTAEKSGFEMQQPMPMRPTRHSVLHLSSPKCNSSLLAQVGGSRCVVRENEVMDNEAWKTRMASSTRGTEHDNYDHQRDESFEDRNVSISPGISAIPNFRGNIHSGPRSDDENSGGKYEYSESWEGCKSPSIQESMDISKGNVSQPGKANCSSHDEVQSSSDFCSKSLSSEYCEVVGETGVSVASDQCTNEENISIEPKYTRSSHRTSSSISWDPPRSRSPNIAGPYQRNFIESPQYKTSHLKQGLTVSRQSIDPEKTSLQHDEIFVSKSGHNPDEINDCSAKSIQKETDENELWMKFVFDEDSQDEGVPSKKATSTKTGSRKNRSKAPRDKSFDVTTSHSPVKHEKGKLEPSPTFSTFAHNSVDTESPLQPRFVAPTRSRAIWQNPQLGENGALDVTSQFSGFSAYTHQSKENYNLPMPSVPASGTRYAEKPRQVNTDSGTKSRASVVHPTNFNVSTPNGSPSSELESVSMIAVPGSQVDISEPTLRRSFLGTQRKVIFTKPRVFVGSRANAQSSSPDRTIRIGGGGTKKRTSNDYVMTLAEDIEDD